jgi:hypothetical protein
MPISTVIDGVRSSFRSQPGGAQPLGRVRILHRVFVGFVMQRVWEDVEIAFRRAARGVYGLRSCAAGSSEAMRGPEDDEGTERER